MMVTLRLELWNYKWIYKAVTKRKNKKLITANEMKSKLIPVRVEFPNQ